MIEGAKILVTGVTGAVAAPLAKFLARSNEVWGLARFLDADDPARKGKELRMTPLETREDVERAGIRTCSADLGSGDLSRVPDDFTYVLHFAFHRVPPGPRQFEMAYRTNAEGTGFLLQHCRKAKAALVVSSGTIYSPHADIDHPYAEDDPIGGAKAPWSPSSPVSKLIQEAVAGFCARAFGLPTTIVRLFMPYGVPTVGPSLDVETMKRGGAVFLQNGPQPQSPIHITDVCEQLEAMLGSAGTPALITNWAGDEIVSTRDWCEMAGRILGIEPRFDLREMPGTHPGFIADTTRCRSLVGPCRIRFADGFEQTVRTHHGGEARAGIRKTDRRRP